MFASSGSFPLLPRLWIAASLALGLATAQTPADLERRLTEQTRLLRDWGGLIRYGSENTELAAPRPGENRIVLFGDQITELWRNATPALFASGAWLDRGVSGQTTDQMLIRFRQDVISLHPKAVVILGGINDVASVHGPSTAEMAGDNLISMAQLGAANGVRVLLASVLPVCECSGPSFIRRRWAERIKEINERLREFCQGGACVYLDFYSAMADGSVLKKDLTQDGILPNAAGYAVMTKLATKAVADVLAGKPRRR